jgi:hypothetical protein
MKKDIVLKPVINKSNKQINFSLKKTSLPRGMRDKLNNLKSIKLDRSNFKW